ncbi:Gfo/Idh/MocA family oxidoreductase [Marinilongibacter aquaticus]|uniref:Gfo/Idh/MocA family protein n=1 Tax=Marinilongibacter aquaticus TaxID=2975157 RepID=UPI0021BD2D94|nr:Gfo/Idh/MocA family oxidoreductase [Marinilongibacter aquaticus]UBM58297.1 Gfo/Idh/MocA family oxidoreductase [Marinilongibacter aquaticus]
MKKTALVLACLWLVASNLFGQDKPLKIGVARLTHGHVGWVFQSEKRGDIEVVGIVEPNKELAQKYAKQHGFSMDKVYNTLDEMLAATHPEAVSAFGSIYEHLEVVQACAPKGVHVMVEKPLAVSFDHAKKMEALAKKHKIHLITNYETTWYPTNHKAYALVKKEGRIGDIRKIIVRDGHKGPKNIHVGDEFFEWLTDPVLNGGGAIIDFGCYGANLVTWLMDGQKPKSVTAITAQLQAENNPKVDDDATILLNYGHATAILEPSWNWPIGRKDMEIYGATGAVYADNRHDLRIRISEGYDGYSEEKETLEERKAPFNDPFLLLTNVIRNKVTLQASDLSALENNVVVVEILDAAVKSAKTGKTVYLKP